jgi:hypothetical protein
MHLAANVEVLKVLRRYQDKLSFEIEDGVIIVQIPFCAFVLLFFIFIVGWPETYSSCSKERLGSAHQILLNESYIRGFSGCT